MNEMFDQSNIRSIDITLLYNTSSYPIYFSHINLTFAIAKKTVTFRGWISLNVVFKR